MDNGKFTREITEITDDELIALQRAIVDELRTRLRHQSIIERRNNDLRRFFS